MAPTFHVLELLAGGLAMLGAATVAAVYILLPRSRQHPAELILIIAVMDMLLVGLMLCGCLAAALEFYCTVDRCHEAWPVPARLRIAPDRGVRS